MLRATRVSIHCVKTRKTKASVFTSGSSAEYSPHFAHTSNQLLTNKLDPLLCLSQVVVCTAGVDARVSRGHLVDDIQGPFAARHS